MADFLLDTHIHIASDDEARYPRAEAPPFETEQYTNTVESYLAKMAEAGVSRAAIVQPFGVYGSDNSYHADSARAHPDRLAAVCGLSPAPDAPERLRYWVRERGMAALRINTRGEKAGLADPAVDPLAEEATALGVPVTIMMSRRHIENAHALAQRHPKLKIALDHLGGAKPDLDNSYERLAALASTPNIFLKISTDSIRADGARARIQALVDAFGAERMMWGTNYPVTDLGGYAATVQAARVGLAFLTSAQQEAILGKAALQLWPMLAPVPQAASR